MKTAIGVLALAFSAAGLLNAQMTLSPKSGTGMSRGFTLTFAPQSIGSVSHADIRIGSCFTTYHDGAFYLVTGANEDGSDIWSRVNPGSVESISNGSCTLYGANSIVSGVPYSGITITFSLAFSQALLGSQSVGAVAEGDGWGYATFTSYDRGTWNVAPVTISNVSVSPSTGSGWTQTFTAVYSDSAGATELGSVSLLFRASAAVAANACNLTYDAALNQIKLQDDAGTSWSSGTLGTAVILQNSQCIVNALNATVARSGANLTLSVPVSFKQTFSGTKQILLQSSPPGGTIVGPNQLGSWSVPIGAPANPVSVSPGSGNGMGSTFTAVFSDAVGVMDINSVAVNIATSASSFSNVCDLNYLRATNQLRLLNDAGTAWAYGTPGASGTLQNSQCSISTATASVSTSGNNLTLVAPITFNPNYVGPKTIFLYADSPEGNSGWQVRGTWNVTPLNISSVGPSGGSGISQTFTVNAIDANGATDLNTVWLYFTPAFNTNPAGACQIYYDRVSNYLYLMNDTGTSGLPTLPGSSGTVSNSQCSLSAAGSGAIGSGTVFTVNFAVTFSAANTGIKQIYAMAKNGSSDTGWMNMGTWNVTAPAGDFSLSAAPVMQSVARGGSASYTVSVNPNVSNSSVTLQAGTPPPGATVTLTPPALSGAGAATLTIATSTNTPIATYTITVIATNGGFVHTVNVTLLVQASGPYQYYVHDNFGYTVIPVGWTQAGALTPTGSGGMTAPDPSGGSLISTVPVPDGSSDYEVGATLRLASSGGTYTLFARATPDARTGGSGSGTFVALDMRDPTFDAGGNCSANYVLLRREAGVVTAVTSLVRGCYNGMTLRLVVRSNLILIYIDRIFIGIYSEASIATGKPGVGAYGTPTGNAITAVQIGPIDRVPPAAVDPQSIGYSAFPNRIDMHWQGVADDPNGIGLWTYYLYRDGAYLGATEQPNYADETVAPGSSHVYQIWAVDEHYGWSAGTAATVTSAPAGTTEPRRIGVRPNGAYWGASGEQIDLLSGNVNYTVPLCKAISRGGWGATFSLNYNSQNWRQDAGGKWRLGRDVGYGFGWRLLAGSVTPVYQGTWAIHHYVFTDSTGAEYRLESNSNNVWTSREDFYGSYDANTGRLYFPDGSFWDMFAQSGGGEDDAGTLYPTALHDTNGNWIVVEYAAAVGLGYSNTSARIRYIKDSRTQGGGFGWQYVFTYNSDPVPHLTSISGPAPENYTFTYLANQTLASPFDGSVSGTAWLLQLVGTTGLNASTGFQYSQTSGEMTQMTTPLGGSIMWDYRTYTYSGGRSYREAQTRQLTGSTNSAPWTWSIALDSNPNLHAAATVADVGAGTQKVWTFANTGPYSGLSTSYEERDATNAALVHKDYTWTQDGYGRPYVGTVIMTLNPGTASAAQTKTVQALDNFGNITQSQVYDYGNLSVPARTYNFAYLYTLNGNYLPRYITNRMAWATVTAAGTTTALASNSYDERLDSQPGALLHDDINYGPNFTFRGNLTSRHTSEGVATFGYHSTGVMAFAVNEAGVRVDNTANASTNYSLPSVITPGGEANLATSISYNGSWAVTSVAGANGSNATTTYDSYGRPASSKIPDGAVTTYAYTYVPATQTATLGSRWTRTTLDGFGRTKTIETGHDAVTVSVAETEYAPCACSPLGKLYRSSRPHAPGTAPQWTTYTYDGSGRTLTVTLPDGSVTRYDYTGNTTKVTDAAGKWKKQTADIFGNLTTVTEPNPNGGADWTTSYFYNVINKLTRVEMPRPYNGGTYTQARTFTYASGYTYATGAALSILYSRMLTETNPETGTITYQYDSGKRLIAKTDAKGQQTQYSYDAFGRVTQTRRYDAGLNEDQGQRVDYHYDTNPLDATFSQNAWGRLTAVEFYGRLPGNSHVFPMQYLYSYNQPGRVTAQRMVVFPPDNVQGSPLIADAAYGWDNEGRMTSLQGPPTNWENPTETYTYDAMGRLSAGGATYGTAGELLTFNGVTRTYNNLGQLTRMTKAGMMDVEYRYVAGQNNGRIWQSRDYVTGEEVTYNYDAVNRLSRAETTDAAWGNAYAYDGWGNLLSKTVTKGSAPSFSQNYDPSLNMPVGSNPPGSPAQPSQYDVEGRSIQGPAEFTTNYGSPWIGGLSYDPSGKKVMWAVDSSQNGETVYGKNITRRYEVYFHSITGQRLARYSGGVYEWTDEYGAYREFGHDFVDRTKHIGGQLTSWNGTGSTTDRLGSIRAKDNGERYTYYPYGEPRTATVAGGGMYAGLESPLRKYDPTKGRFDRPDPLGLQGVVMGDPSGEIR